MNRTKINEALETIELEYMKLSNSIDRYNLREEVIQRLDKVRQRMNDFVRDSDTPEITALRVQISSVLEEFSGVKREYINEAFENNYTKGECRNELGIDDLDWIEFIMGVEDKLNVEFPLSYEEDLTTLNMLVEFICTKK